MSEAAVKRSDLASFDPDTPLEKLRWAREEMQRNIQQPMSARAMRVCTVCSERWDTAEDGGGDCRWVVSHVSREHSTAAVGFRFLIPGLEYSSFWVSQKQLHQQQACTLLYKQTDKNEDVNLQIKLGCLSLIHI